MKRKSLGSQYGWIVAVWLALIFGATTSLTAAPRRVLPAGEIPKDKRLDKLKDLNGYFPFTPSKSPEEWNERAAELRRQVLLANGLWPMPTKTPLDAMIHGKVERDGYTVEKVYFQSYPGHFVTGSLYRPKGKSGRLPGVLCPHGHWANGRFFEHGDAAIKRELASGGEKHEVSGRYPLQARCVQLARMGCVVFHYDMLGYADSVQLTHRPGSREAMNTPENWGFFSPQAELRQQTMMGLQTYNSVRALDFLCDLPDVDASRIGVTGASGGGTQTFLLCAVDSRPTVAFPAVMVSTAMQGGCTCENANYLRLNTGNIELAALFAPKPLGMSAADDWTKEIATKGLPELKQHYAMFGVPELVMAQHFDFPHNYNYVSRALMYQWFNQHLKLGQSEPVVEEDFQPLSQQELTVWNEDHPKPPSGDEYERSLLRTMTEISDRQLEELIPDDAGKLAEFRKVIGGAWSTMIGRTLPKAGTIQFEQTSENDRGTYLEFAGLLRNAAHGEELPALFLQPKQWNKHVVVWVTEQGKQELYDTSGELDPAIRKLLEAGSAVASLDLFYQGEFLADGQPIERARLVKSGRDTWAAYSGYTYGYNHALLAQRTHDILTMLSFVRNHEDQPQQVHVVGIGKAGVLAAAAAAVAPQAVDRLAVDTGGFRFRNLTAIDDPYFLPGAVKYGDVPALLALATVKKLFVAGEDVGSLLLTTKARETGGMGADLERANASGAAFGPAAASWLTDRR
jgi:cephalosporin-C deacetylase-like acetyl esterase